MGDSTEMLTARLRVSWRRPLIAAVVALSALALAVVSSLAIEQTRTTYAWSYPEAPQDSAGEWRLVAATGSFTPLLLAAPPFHWDLRWSCGIDLPADDSEHFEVFGSIVHDEFGPGLRVTVVGDTFAVVIGGEAVVTTARPVNGSPGCSYRFILDDAGAWSLREGDQVLDEGTTAERPRVNGFGSDLIGAEVTGSVGAVVTTQRHGSTASARVRITQISSVMLGAISVALLFWAWRDEEFTEGDRQ